MGGVFLSSSDDTLNIVDFCKNLLGRREEKRELGNLQRKGIRTLKSI